MEFSINAKVLGLIAVAAVAGVSGRAAAQPPRTSWLGPSQVDSPIKVIHLRKAARTLFGFGMVQDDDAPIDLGPARARLLWQKGWKWSESSDSCRLPMGLQGGPMLSLDMPLGPLGHLGRRLFSLETRLSSLRYVFASARTDRPRTDELVDPQHSRQSFEAGLYFNVSFGGLR